LRSRCSAGRQAAASREVYQSRPRVLRGQTEPEGLAGQAVEHNKWALQDELGCSLVTSAHLSGCHRRGEYVSGSWRSVPRDLRSGRGPSSARSCHWPISRKRSRRGRSIGVVHSSPLRDTDRCTRGVASEGKRPPWAPVSLSLTRPQNPRQPSAASAGSTVAVTMMCPSCQATICGAGFGSCGDSAFR
jgi:hypothetical protein